MPYWYLPPLHRIEETTRATQLSVLHGDAHDSFLENCTAVLRLNYGIYQDLVITGERVIGACSSLPGAGGPIILDR